MIGLACNKYQEYEFFKHYGIKGKLHKKLIRKYACVDPDRKYIYYRIPKSANTTVVATLLSNRPEVNKKGIRKKSFDSIGELSVNEIKKMVSFTLVRCPYSRVLSAYLNKIREGRRGELVKKSLSLKSDQPISFTHFVHYLERGGLHIDGHWAPQSSIAPADKIESLVVLKFENIDKELPDFLKTYLPYLYVQRQALHATKASSLLTTYYTPEISKRVYELYKNDFQIFGYQR